jgi:hypothetical protein
VSLTVPKARRRAICGTSRTGKACCSEIEGVLAIAILVRVPFRASLSEEFQAHLDTLERWLEYLADYRHAVAHRIPLYIPPGNVRSKDVDAYNELEYRIAAALNSFQPDEYERLLAEQSKLLVFQPVIGTPSLR